jgi:hypothetical protein
MTMPAGAILRKPTSWRLSAAPQPTTPNGKLLGRPRGDRLLFDVLSTTEWRTFQEIKEALGTSYGTVQQRLYRAKTRGTIELRRGVGYRLPRRPAL